MLRPRGCEAARRYPLVGQHQGAHQTRRLGDFARCHLLEILALQDLALRHRRPRVELGFAPSRRIRRAVPVEGLRHPQGGGLAPLLTRS